MTRIVSRDPAKWSYYSDEPKISKNIKMIKKGKERKKNDRTLNEPIPLSIVNIIKSENISVPIDQLLLQNIANEMGS